MSKLSEIFRTFGLGLLPVSRTPSLLSPEPGAGPLAPKEDEPDGAKILFDYLELGDCRIIGKEGLYRERWIDGAEPPDVISEQEPDELAPDEVELIAIPRVPLETEHHHETDRGLLAVTNKRFVFIGATKKITINLKNITTIDLGADDTILIICREKQQVGWFKVPDNMFVKFYHDTKDYTVQLTGELLHVAVLGVLHRSRGVVGLDAEIVESAR